MQGTIVLSIVIAYEVVARINLRQQQRAVGKVNTLKFLLKWSPSNELHESKVQR
jgi:hypothetical protein